MHVRMYEVTVYSIYCKFVFGLRISIDAKFPELDNWAT